LQPGKDGADPQSKGREFDDVSHSRPIFRSALEVDKSSYENAARGGPEQAAQEQLKKAIHGGSSSSDQLIGASLAKYYQRLLRA
jgi:hypothetical protein